MFLAFVGGKVDIRKEGSSNSNYVWIDFMLFTLEMFTFLFYLDFICRGIKAEQEDRSFCRVLRQDGRKLASTIPRSRSSGSKQTEGWGA